MLDGLVVGVVGMAVIMAFTDRFMTQTLWLIALAVGYTLFKHWVLGL